MMQTIQKAKVKKKKVLLRVDLNVPMDESRNITDDFRIRAVLPTLEYLLRQDAKIIMMSHLGRPEGKRDEQYSLNAVQDRLFEYLDVSIGLAPDCIGSQVEEIARDMAEGDIVLLENLRFHPEEEATDENFARQLASLGDIYINDAFGASHRAHASIVKVPLFLPSFAGLLVEKEVSYLSRIKENPSRPLVLIMGGAKAKEKLEVLEALFDRADHICIGGILANTILKAKGIAVGRSKIAKDADDLMGGLKLTDPSMHLPVDVVVADDLNNPSYVATRAVGDVRDNEYILDIGPETSKLFVNVIYGAQTIFWNGPMGIFENPEFARGTETIAHAIAAHKGIKIVGGGEAAAALEQWNLAGLIDHISTGGGAMLEFLAGKRLPGLEVLGYYEESDES